jgi:hypothetical protein
MISEAPNKYVLRNYSKDNLRLLSYTLFEYSQGKTGYNVLMFLQERQVMFNCFSSEVMNIIKNTNPQEKIKVWFIVNSKKVNNKYYNNISLRWAENPRLIEIEKIKSTGLNIFNEDF